jgi:hypothetical protein
MKYQAPVGVTALFCAGEEISLDEQGAFEASALLAAELAAHGFVPAVASEGAAAEKSADTRPRARARAEKAN